MFTATMSNTFYFFSNIKRLYMYSLILNPIVKTRNHLKNETEIKWKKKKKLKKKKET